MFVYDQEHFVDADVCISGGRETGDLIGGKAGGGGVLVPSQGQVRTKKCSRNLSFLLPFGICSSELDKSCLWNFALINDECISIIQKPGKNDLYCISILDLKCDFQ